jgi:N-acetylglutamate synthase-like GNAT family acetyltransferase
MWVVTATVMGYPIGLCWSVPFAGDDRCAYLEEVAVVDAWQCLGVGTRLVVESLLWLAQSGFETATVFPVGSSRWVEKIGFEKFSNTLYVRSLTALPRFETNDLQIS